MRLLGWGPDPIRLVSVLEEKKMPGTHTRTEGGPCEDPARGPPSPSQRERPQQRLTFLAS